MPNCLTCGSGIDEYDSGYYSRNMLCIPCYSRKASEVPMASCGKCGVRIRQDEARNRRGTYYCNYCVGELERLDRVPGCAICRQKVESYDRSMKSAKGMVHVSCAESVMREGAVTAICSNCLKETKFFKVMPNNDVLCLKCGKLSPQERGSKPPASSLMASAVNRIRDFIRS